MAMPRALTVGRAPRPTRGSRRTRTRLLALVAALALLALAVVLGLAVGARPVAFDEVLRILTGAASRRNLDLYRGHGFRVVGQDVDEVGVPVLTLRRDPPASGTSAPEA